MKSQRWTVVCEDNEIKILKSQKTDCVAASEKDIYETKDLKFSLGFNQQGRLFMYKLLLDEGLQSKSVVGNIINIIFNKSVPKDTVLNIIYEDHSIRLLAFAENGTEDFVLVGRWRSE